MVGWSSQLGGGPTRGRSALPPCGGRCRPSPSHIRRVGGGPTGSGRPSPASGGGVQAPPDTRLSPAVPPPQLKATGPTRMCASQRMRRHSPMHVTPQTNHAVRSHLQTTSLSWPTELADGLALKEPAPPTARRGIRPNNSGPPFSDTSAETRRIRRKLAGVQ